MNMKSWSAKAILAKASSDPANVLGAAEAHTGGDSNSPRTRSAASLVSRQKSASSKACLAWGDQVRGWAALPYLADRTSER